MAAEVNGPRFSIIWKESENSYESHKHLGEFVKLRIEPLGRTIMLPPKNENKFGCGIGAYRCSLEEAKVLKVVLTLLDKSEGEKEVEVPLDLQFSPWSGWGKYDDEYNIHVNGSEAIVDTKLALWWP